MKKVTLLSALCLIGALCAQTFAQNVSHKYPAAPNLQINRGQTATHRIMVTDNVKVADVRIAVFAKTVMYSSLRVELISPEGTTVVLKDALPIGVTPWYGPLGTRDSYCLFRDGGEIMTNATAPNDRVFQPTNFLSLVNGENAQGWWTLKVIDEPTFVVGSAPQSGTWYAWTLMFNEIIEEPELVLFEQTLVGSSLTPQISGRDAAGAIIPNYNGDLGDACLSGLYDLGLNGDCFPFVITGIPGNIGDVVPPFASPGRFELDVNIATNYPAGPQTGALTEDIGIYFGQAEENWAGSLPAPPAVHPNPKVVSGWPTGPATSVTSLYPGPNGLNGGVELISCETFAGLAPGDFGGYSGALFTDAALTDITQAGPCGGIVDPTAGICGTFMPEQPLAAMAGARAVNGLYYVTIYDAYGDSESQLRDPSGLLKFGQVRVLSLTLRYIAGGGDTPKQDLHQGLAGPLMGVPTPGAIDGAILGYRTSVGNTIPPYTYHAIKDITGQAREPIMYFSNIQKLYPGNSIGYMHEELINATNNSWQPVGNHGPLAYPGALDDNSFDPTVNGNSEYVDVIQIANGAWKIRHKLVQARYDDDPGDNEATGPVFHVTPNTWAYYKDKVHSTTNFTNPTQAGLPIPAYLGPGTGVSVAFTIFEWPTTKIVSVDFLMDMLASTGGPTPQSDFRVTIWPAEFGAAGAPSGNPVARSPIVAASQYIPGTENWRTVPMHPLDQQGQVDLSILGVDLAPGTYFVTLDVLGQGQVVLFPYTYGQAPTLDDRIMTYNFSDNFGPLGPAATLGSHLTYLTTDIAAPPDLAWGATNAPIMANFTAAVKLNMDHLYDWAVDYVTFDGTLGNESVALPNAPFVPSVFVSSRTLQGGVPASCTVHMKIYQGATWQPTDYNFSQVATLNPFQTVQVSPPSFQNWSPTTGGSYTVEVTLTHSNLDLNLVNNSLKFDIFVSATSAIIAKGKNISTGKVNDLQSLLESRGHDVSIVDAADASIAGATNSTIYVVGDVSNTEVLSTAVNNGNDLAFVNDEAVKSVINVDKIFQVERVSDYDVSEVKLSAELRQVDEMEPVDIEPVHIDLRNKADLLQYVASQDFKAEDVQMITPSEKAIAAQRTDFESVLPAAKSSPFGDITYISEKSTGIIYAIPSIRKSGVTPVAATFNLEQNYPNPFNPSTSISYTLTDDAQVTLRVLDMLGKEVVELVSGQKVAGTYTVSFNGTDASGKVIPSGTYIYRIDVTTADGQSFTNSKTMTLSK